MSGSILKAVAMEASARNDQGEEIARRHRSIPCGLYGDFLLRTDRAVYRGGDTMKLTALGDSASPLFVDLIREGQTLRTETIEMANDKGEMSVDLPPDLSGTVQVVGYRVDAKGWPVRKTPSSTSVPPIRSTSSPRSTPTRRSTSRATGRRCV